MSAARNPMGTNTVAPNTACPPRRSCVAGAARRRGQACASHYQQPIAFGGTDTALRFNLIMDDYGTINPVTRTPR
jgi:hypothetical protein